MSDVKGKEMEQDRKGTVKNQDIDLNRTHQNYDLVESDLTLYQRVKERVNYAKETGSRVQKNSVVMYSNILTVPEEMAKMVEQMTQGIDDEIQAQYQRILDEYGDVFTSEERRTMGR